jgi:hypothetical protein
VSRSRGGKIEAKDGLLVISGGVAGNGTVQIDNNETVEISGAVGSRVSVTFQSGGTGTLILDNPKLFGGLIVGLTDGDQIILTSTGSATSPKANEVVAATIGSSSTTGQAVLILGGSDSLHLNSVYKLRISGPANDPILTGQSTEEPHFFGVTSGGSGSSNYTTLTLSSGSPIAQALGFTQSASALGNGASFTGAGIKIGIISDSFNFNSATGKEAAINTGPVVTDVNNGLLPKGIIDLATGATISGNPADEGRAMAEIVHAIAPGASIVFQSLRAEPEYIRGDPEAQIAAMAHAIKDLQAQHVQIIVDDVGLPAEPDQGGATNSAIGNAVLNGISYFTAAGNSRVAHNGIPALPIFGHSDDPFAVTVAAINYLASSDPPSLTAPYLQTATEPFSSIGKENSGKPNITAPDGDPTSLALGNGLDPFFGTSAAAPAAAAVAALMMQANPQLKTQSFNLESLIQKYVVQISGRTDAAGSGDLATVRQRLHRRGGAVPAHLRRSAQNQRYADVHAQR